MAYRLAPQAEADLEDIAFYVFLDSGSLEIADTLKRLCSSRLPADSRTDRKVELGWICRSRSATLCSGARCEATNK
jgi:hypothetical protein